MKCAFLVLIVLLFGIATTAGAKTIRLPFAGTLTDLSSGELFVLPEGQPLVLTFAEGETRLFSIKRGGATSSL